MNIIEENVYYGVVELANHIGWNKSKVHVYWKRGKIEEPNAYVGKRPLWTGEQLERIKKEIGGI